MALLNNIYKQEKPKMVMKKKRIFCIIFVLIFIFLVGFVFAESGETYSEFEIAGLQPSCQFNAEGDISFWAEWDGSDVIRSEIGIPIPPKISCYNSNGWPSTGCCPGEVQCDVMEPLDEQTCSLIAPTFCSDYNDYGDDAENYCKGFNINTAKRSVEERIGIEGVCSGTYSSPILDFNEYTNCNQFTYNCRCYWDENAGLCKSTSTSSTWCDGFTNPIEGNCTFTTTSKINTCDTDGFITYTWGAIWSNSSETQPAECVGGSKVFDCSITRLSFFNWINITIIIIILVIIYFIYYRTKSFQKRFRSKTRK